MTTRGLAFALALAAPALAPGGAPAAPAFRACPAAEAPGFQCATISVPLDRTGRLPGRIALRVARETRAAGTATRTMIVLTGGPGQPGVAFGPGWQEVLAGVRDRYRLVVLDPRGTGRSGLLRCPSLQRQSLTDVTVRAPGSVEACAARLGAARDAYSTTETVEDLEALRAALGADRVALAGVSYGTYYALRYARAHPARVERLILDSVVPQENVGLHLDATWPAIRRLLRELCAGPRCDRLTADPAADLRRVVARLARRPLEATLYDGRGRPRRVTMDATDLYDLLLASAADDGLRGELPALLAAAARHDPAPLLRVARRVLGGQRVPAGVLSWGLHVATLCADLPRPAAAAPPDAAVLEPFTPAMAAANGMRDACTRWPDPAVPPPPEPGPLPDVPVLLLAGQHDVLTPRSDALREAARAARAEVVIVPGVGHSVLTGRNDCARAAARRFVHGRPAAAPCRRAAARLPLRLRGRYPQRLREVPRVGVPGRGGLALAVALATLEDAQANVARGGAVGGLRGGSVVFGRDGSSVRLRAARYVPGVAVSGTLTGVAWRLEVRGRGLVARFTVDREGAVRGVADGRPFAYRAP